MPGSRPHAPHWPRSSTERRELSAIGRDRCARLIGTGLANRGAEQRAPNKSGPKDENGMTESEGSGEKTCQNRWRFEQFVGWNRGVSVLIMFHRPGFMVSAPKLPRRDL